MTFDWLSKKKAKFQYRLFSVKRRKDTTDTLQITEMCGSTQHCSGEETTGFLMWLKVGWLPRIGEDLAKKLKKMTS